jgi:hypothetical protein
MAQAAYASEINSGSRQWFLRAVRGVSGIADKEGIWAWSIWAVLSLAGFCFVAVFGLRFPLGDEWHWVGRVTGDEPVTLAWLWSQHNEHRMFLPRLIYLGLGAISGHDFRAGCFFNVFILSGLSFAMMAAARRMRGKTSLCDAFFPLALLHWGQYDNLIWGFQLNFVTSVVLEGCILLIVLRTGRRISMKSVVLLTLFLVLLGLCGSYGLVFLPPMACWLIYASARTWLKDGKAAWRVVLATLALAVVPLALVALYVHGLSAKPAYSGFYATLRTGLEFISFGIGQAAKEIWPISGLLAVAACAIIARQGLWVFRKQSAERLRTAGFLLFFTGIIALAIAIGLGRGFMGPMIGFEPRYMTLAVPLLLLVYVQSEAQGGPLMKRHVQRVLFVLMAGLFIVNTQKGIVYSSQLNEHLVKFEQDMRDGVPPEFLGVRYADQWGYGAKDVFTSRIAWLQKARLGPYRCPTSKSGQAVRVERICRQTLAADKLEPVRLAAGQSFTQIFTVQTDGELRRMDLKIEICRDGRPLKRLDWALFDADPSGNDLLAQHYVDPIEVCDGYYLSIPVNRIFLRKSRQFALVLSIPSDHPGMSSITIPIYNAAGDKDMEQSIAIGKCGMEREMPGFLQGFMYLESSGASTPLVARRPGE